MSAADDAALAAALLAVGGASLGGACLHCLPSPARTLWLELLRELLPSSVVVRRIPFNIPDGRLLGGLDLAATLNANRPVAERGALAAADGGIIVVAMAERLSAHTAACLNRTLDTGEVRVEREGVELQDAARIAVIALDEGLEDEHVPVALLDRLAFLIDLSGFDLRTPLLVPYEADDVAEAVRRLPDVTLPDSVTEALCGTALALGAGSLRVSLLALNAARALAALDGRTEAGAADAVTAARLVLAPRATRVPQPAAAEQAGADAADSPPAERSPGEPPPVPQSAAEETGSDDASRDEARSDAPQSETREPPRDLEDVVLAAAQAAIPAGLLALLTAGAPGRAAPVASGRAGALRQGGTRGRPAGIRSGAPRGNSRLNVMETLRAAAPWQRLRGRTGAGRVRIAADDFRVTRYQQRAPTLTIFVVDASGSSALNRLAEAKGAVELLLADCYVRRDQVAVITFRGRQAELLLPPTRSLVRAKRQLAGLPGGGGTPLAAAIDAAALLAAQARRRGETPLLVLLTDGRANVARSGAGGRDAAHADALKAARALTQAGIAALFVDTSPRPNPLAGQIAAAMNARYVPLPFASAQSLSRVVGAAAAAAG